MFDFCCGVCVGVRRLTANLRLCAGISCACIRYRIGRYGCKAKSLPAIVPVAGLRPRLPATWITRGACTSTLAMTASTVRPSTTTFGSCAADSDFLGFVFVGSGGLR